jgi:hypothetical protein
MFTKYLLLKENIKLFFSLLNLVVLSMGSLYKNKEHSLLQK